MKQMRRYLALLLALTMVLGMFPAAAAEETAEEAPVVLMEELTEIEVADDQELLAYLEDSEAQRLLIRDEMTLTLARDLESNDEVYWAENGVLHVEGAVLTCAAIDMMAFDETELAEAMGEEPFCNMDAPHRNIWVFEGVDLADVELPANRTLSWVAPLREDNVIDGTWPVLQTLFVPEGAGLTVQTDLTVENAAIVNGALFLENGAKLKHRPPVGLGPKSRSASSGQRNHIHMVLHGAHQLERSVKAGTTARRDVAGRLQGERGADACSKRAVAHAVDVDAGHCASFDRVSQRG